MVFFRCIYTIYITSFPKNIINFHKKPFMHNRIVLMILNNIANYYIYVVYFLIFKKLTKSIFNVIIDLIIFLIKYK